jgi:hypothetical protein
VNALQFPKIILKKIQRFLMTGKQRPLKALCVAFQAPQGSFPPQALAESDRAQRRPPGHSDQARETLRVAQARRFS